MLTGDVIFTSKILRGNSVKFDRLSLGLSSAQVTDLAISCDGDEVVVVVTIKEASSEEEGTRIATAMNEQSLDRLMLVQLLSLDRPRMTSGLKPINTDPNVLQVRAAESVLMGESLRAVTTVSGTNLKKAMEAPPLQGERYLGLLRSALRSEGAVERFMHLYQLLLMLRGDKQQNVDAFICRHEPTVTQTPSPKFTGVLETVYTRLRNEFGHVRAGVDLDATKAGMASEADRLAALVKEAIAEV